MNYRSICRTVRQAFYKSEFKSMAHNKACNRSNVIVLFVGLATAPHTKITMQLAMMQRENW